MSDGKWHVDPRWKLDDGHSEGLKWVNIVFLVVLSSQHPHLQIFTIVLYIFESIPNDCKVNNFEQVVCHLGKWHALWFIRNEIKCPLQWEILIYYFSQGILERVFVGSIVDVRNECPLSWSMGNESGCRTNKLSKNNQDTGMPLFVSI